MFQARITHEGLNAFRALRGYTADEVQTRARLQLAARAERWQRKQEIESGRQRQIEKRTAWEQQAEVDKRRKSLALKRTLEAEAAVETFRNLPASALGVAPTFHWEGLRDQTQFTTPEPQAPSLNPLPEQPRDDESRFLPKPLGQASSHSVTYLAGKAIRTLVDWIIPSLRERRELESRQGPQRRKPQADQKFLPASSESQ